MTLSRKDLTMNPQADGGAGLQEEWQKNFGFYNTLNDSVSNNVFSSKMFSFVVVVVVADAAGAAAVGLFIL